MLIKEEQNNAKVNVVSYKAVEGDSVFYSVKNPKFFWFMQIWIVLCKLSLNFSALFSALLCLQCFNTVGWVSGRASGLQKIE